MTMLAFLTEQAFSCIGFENSFSGISLTNDVFSGAFWGFSDLVSKLLEFKAG